MKTERMRVAAVGALLRAHRSTRKMSQLDLALQAGISARHLSFVETGRSTPSRELVIGLAETLGVSLRDRNALLEAAGYAAVYNETAIDDESLAEVREALAQILRAGEPNPTMVLNRRWDVLMANATARALLAAFSAAPLPELPNIARLIASETGMRRFIENWNGVAVHVFERIRREVGGLRQRTPADDDLLAEILPASVQVHAQGLVPTRPLTPVKFRRGDLAVDLWTFITTFGSPQDVTLQEIRIETLFPADEASRRALRSLPPA